MTFEDLEKQFRDSRPSASDLGATEKSFEVWGAVLETSVEPDKFIQRRNALSLVAAVAFVIAVGVVLIAPKSEKTLTTATAPNATTTASTTVDSPSPLSGFSSGSEKAAIEREVQRLNSLKSCLDTASYRSLIDAYFDETEFSDWQVSTSTELQNNRCAFGEISPDLQVIQVSYR
jgi:hypothetical protein